MSVKALCHVIFPCLPGIFSTKVLGDFCVKDGINCDLSLFLQLLKKFRRI